MPTLQWGRLAGAGRVRPAEAPPSTACYEKTPGRLRGTSLRAAVKLWQLVFQIWNLPDCVREVVFNSTLHTLVSGLSSALLHRPQVSFIPSRCPALAPGTTPGHSSLVPACPTEGVGHQDSRQAEGLAEAVGYTTAEKQDH